MKQQHAGGIDWHYEEWGESASLTLLLLHGFTGSTQSWSSFVGLLSPNFRIVAVDLPGQGKTATPEKPLSLFRLANALAEFIRALELNPVNVLGYSMGGRIALHLGLANPELLSSLMLIGASPGITDTQERQKRRETDFALAESIRVQGIEWFVEFWEKQPIFKSQVSLADEDREKLKQQRLQNDPNGLAYALESWSSGCQEDLLPRCSELNLPVLLLAGEKDSKYRKLNEAIYKGIQENTFNHIIGGAGHAVQVEQPQATAKVVNAFLQRIQE